MSRAKSKEVHGQRPDISDGAASPPPPRSIAIFDREAVSKQLRLATAGGEHLNEHDIPVVLSVSSDEQTRVERLRVLADMNPSRPLLVTDASVQPALAGLRAECPAFSDVIAIVERAAALSTLTGTGLALPAMLLVGPPGLGKTHFVRRLAGALGVEQHAFSCATNSDAQALLFGHPPTWRGARQGVLTEALLGGDSANPLIVLDEVDKFVTRSSEKPYNSLLAILEPENACALVDEYLRVPFDLSRCLIIATANDLEALPEFIRDRFLTIAIAPPDRATLQAIARRIAADVITDHGSAFALPDPDVVARLASSNPRGIRRLLSLALGHAAQAQRRHLNVADVTAAEALVGEGSAREPIGFIPPSRKAETGPERG